MATGLIITVPDPVVVNTSTLTTWTRSEGDPEIWDLYIARNFTDYKLLFPVNSAGSSSGVTNIALTTTG